MESILAFQFKRCHFHTSHNAWWRGCPCQASTTRFTPTMRTLWTWKLNSIQELKCALCKIIPPYLAWILLLLWLLWSFIFKFGLRLHLLSFFLWWRSSRQLFARLRQGLRLGLGSGLRLCGLKLGGDKLHGLKLLGDTIRQELWLPRRPPSTPRSVWDGWR